MSLTILQRSGPQYCGSSQKVNSSMTAGQNRPRMEKQTAPTSEMKGSRSGSAMAIRTATDTNAITLIIIIIIIDEQTKVKKLTASSARCYSNDFKYNYQLKYANYLELLLVMNTNTEIKTTVIICDTM